MQSNNPSDFFSQDDNQSDLFSQNNTTPQPPIVPEQPMKWHKFLIYFSLWAGAVLNVFSAIGFLTGSLYTVSGGDPATVYSVFDGLKTVDVLVGLMSLGLAALLIVTRFSLAGFKANGPKLLMMAYAADVVMALLYAIIAAAVTGLSFIDLMDSSSISSIVTGLVMIFVNKAYYDKRASLFVN